MIAIYTLSNGEQIMGEFQGFKGNRATIQNPFYIVETQDEFGNNGMKLINVCTFSTEQYIVIDNMHIIYSRLSILYLFKRHIYEVRKY